MKKHLVSIITPTYNHEKFIGKCIESALEQTYSEWEMIIIDDGSTDKTKDIIARYADKRIRYIKQDNAGIWKLGKIYNKALKISRGKLIAVLEGDDYWPPWKLEKQVPIFEDKDVVLSWGKAVIVDHQGEVMDIIPKNVEKFKNNINKKKIIKELLLRNFIPACTTVIRKDSLLSIGGFYQPKYAPFADYPTWLNLVLLGKFYFIDEVLGFWRKHQKQVSSRMMLSMTQARSKYALDFFTKLSLEQKNSINLSLNELLTRQRHSVASVHFTWGRKALINREWVKAKTYMKEAFSKGNPRIKAGALLGLLSSFIKKDMEWVIDILHKQ
jgi:glycosyltransferase involved in cell wall biosynthesis